MGGTESRETEMGEIGIIEPVKPWVNVALFAFGTRRARLGDKPWEYVPPFACGTGRARLGHGLGSS